MALLVYSTPGPPEPWLSAIRAGLPEMDLRTPDAQGDPADIEYAVVAGAPPGALAAHPNLKLIVTLLAGVEGLLADPDLPGVPIARATDPRGDDMISDFALLHVLRHHRNMPEFAVAQGNREWLRLRPKPKAERRVGFMGLGAIGRPAAERVRDYGFPVAAWTRTPKSVPGIESFHGPEELAPFLGGVEILVNLLALTPETENILSAKTLAFLPKGASVVNLARGHHIVDADLIAALDSEHVAAATLDVFRQEPLPAGHPFWTHPGITITPHTSRAIMPAKIVPQLVENVRRVEAGEPPLQQIDRAAGY